MSGHQAVALDDQIFIFGGDEGAQNVYCDWTNIHEGPCWGQFGSCLKAHDWQSTSYARLAAKVITLCNQNGRSFLPFCWVHGQVMGVWFMAWKQLEL